MNVCTRKAFGKIRAFYILLLLPLLLRYTIGITTLTKKKTLFFVLPTMFKIVLRKEQRES